MISFPSSLRSSLREDKQNLNPNNQKIQISRESPEQIKQKKTIPMKYQQYYSISHRINQIKKQELSNSQNTNHSLKCLFKAVNSPINQYLCISDRSSLVQVVRQFINNKQLSLRQVIEICQENNIYNRQDIYNSVKNSSPIKKTNQKPKNRQLPFKQMLLTQLGNIKIDQLCETINKGYHLTQQQQKILQSLIKDESNKKLDEDIIKKSYEILKQQLGYELNQLKKLQQQYKIIYIKKINKKLSTAHYQIQIINSITKYSCNNRIGYNQLYIILSQLLNQQQISLIFKYIYVIQTSVFMTIIDPSKKINSSLLLFYLFPNQGNQSSSCYFQEKNLKYVSEEKHHLFVKIQKQNQLYQQTIKQQNQEIQRLNRIIDLMTIEKQQQRKYNEQTLNTLIISLKKKYESQILSLKQNNKEQMKITQWYQRQLQTIVNHVNKQHVMRRFLINKQISTKEV